MFKLSKVHADDHRGQSASQSEKLAASRASVVTSWQLRSAIQNILPILGLTAVLIISATAEKNMSGMRNAIRLMASSSKTAKRSDCICQQRWALGAVAVRRPPSAS